MLASRDNLTVELHRHSCFSKTEVFDELTHGLARLGLMFLAIDSQFHNRFIIPDELRLREGFCPASQPAMELTPELPAAGLLSFSGSIGPLSE